MYNPLLSYLRVFGTQDAYVILTCTNCIVEIVLVRHLCCRIFGTVLLNNTAYTSTTKILIYTNEYGTQYR